MIRRILLLSALAASIFALLTMDAEAGTWKDCSGNTLENQGAQSLGKPVSCVVYEYTSADAAPHDLAVVRFKFGGSVQVLQTNTAGAVQTAVNVQLYSLFAGCDGVARTNCPAICPAAGCTLTGVGGTPAAQLAGTSVLPGIVVGTRITDTCDTGTCSIVFLGGLQ